MKQASAVYLCFHRLGVWLSLAVCALFFTATVLPTPKACAEGFALYEWSARGIALGGATMARRPDPSAVAYNPALIARLPGVHVQGGMSFVTPHGKITTYEAGRGPITDTVNTRTWYIPHGYYTHQLNDKWTFGMGMFSRFGLGFKYNNDWEGRFNARSVSLQTASLTPVMAYKVNDKLSLAAGLDLMYVTLDITKNSILDFKSLGSAEIQSQVKGADGFAFGGVFSAHYQFNDHWAAGVNYRTQARIRARGENEFKLKGVTGSLRPEAVKAGLHNSGARGTVILPDSLAFGLAWMPTEKFSLEGGATWTRWSHFRTLRIHLGDPTNKVAESKKQWSDSWRINVGAEYDVTDWLALRAGYVYDQSPMTSSWADYLVPTNGRHIYSVGAGVKYDNWTFDAAYGYVDIDGRRYQKKNDASNEYHGVLDSKTHDGMSHIMSFSIGYEF